MSPTGLVPALVHDGKAIYESNVIDEYLDATFPFPPLVPKDPWGQAHMRCGPPSRTISRSRSAMRSTRPSARNA